MRFVLGLLSMVAFVIVLLMAYIFVAGRPEQPELFGLVLVVFIGLGVFFRALRSRIA